MRSPERCQELLEWMRKKCISGLVWTINDGHTPIGMLILGRLTILYVVVAQEFRGQKIGPALVRRIQSIDHLSSLRAEARNECSERMLISCGFHRCGEDDDSGYPIFIWKRAAKAPTARLPKRRRSVSDLLSEFGFIPSELLSKCDLFVKAFHKRRGSGKEFVAASMMFSAGSPYLTD